jgi:hypothetical protein
MTVMTASERARELVTAALIYRAGGGDPRDLLLYGDLQRELIDEGDPVAVKATVAALVQLLTTAVLIWAAGVDIDPLTLWARISQELAATEGM